MPSLVGRSTRLVLCLAFALFVITGVSKAQDGVSDVGAARTKYLGNLGVIPSPRDVVVEDIVNYHRHDIGRPKAGEAVGMDVRWASVSVSPGGEAVLQVGLSTALASDRQHLRPLNLSIVIDKSGSMTDDNKLTRVKESLLTLVSQLRPSDVLSIVVFDADAHVLLPAQYVTDPESIEGLIRGIQPGSTTNLNGGLMLGYQEASKHFRKDATNRVILLTDGIANRGVTDPDEIARASASYNDRGIDLTTIGVGLDLNKDLLQKLAKSGRGVFHFVADSDDIQKVFVKELQSLISPVASEPNLEIQYGSGLKLEKVYGYEPRVEANSVKIKLANMNSGMTEVVLLRFKLNGETDDEAHIPVSARLSYYDLDRSKSVETSEKAPIAVSEGRRRDMLEDSSVAKNYSIALLAQAIHDMASDCEGHQYRQAQNVLDGAIAKTMQRYPSLDDEDIKRPLATAVKYQEVLRRENHDTVNRETDGEIAETGSHGNIVVNGDFSLGNTGFTSGLDYAAPAENCLWGCYYTIAPIFNNPRLHTLIPNQEFAAPKRPNGNEKVYFANAGIPGSLVLWSSVVKCKPNTQYRISFQAITFNPGPEWVPSYEIRIGGESSEAQQVKYGGYTEVTMNWNSKDASSATVSIVRLPIVRGGLIGISNIEMVPAQ